MVTTQVSEAGKPQSARSNAQHQQSPDDLINSAVVRRMIGNISDMTLWRWSHNPDLDFPEPDVVINGRKFWYQSTIERWRADRATKRQVNAS
jgi:predicted DNA-binding transcriptional regulator AlpA